MVPAFLDSFGDGYKQMKHRIPISTILLGVAVASVQAQGPKAISQDANLRYSQRQITTLIESCAPGAAPSTMLAVATTESALYPYAISLNRPIQIAQAIGLANSQIQLARQPHSRQEAIQWMHWLLGEIRERSRSPSVQLLTYVVEEPDSEKARVIAVRELTEMIRSGSN